MNENPEGTPVQPAQPAESVPEQVMPTPSVAPASATEPVAGPATEPASEPAKKKSGLIVAIIAIVAVLGCVGAAIAMLNPFGGSNDDRMAKALSKLFSEDAPTKVAMDGTVSIHPNADKNVSPISEVTIDFKSGFNMASNANSAEADINIILTDETKLNIQADEVYTENGDLYLKLSGISDTIENYNKASDDTDVPRGDCDSEYYDNDYIIDGTDCIDPLDETKYYLNMLDSLGVVDAIDGEWILISTNALDDEIGLTDSNNPTQCLVDTLSAADEYADELSNIYANYPFITYSTENLGIAKKKNELYKVEISAEALTGFMNEIKNHELISKINTCLGMSSAEDAEEVEVDNMVEAVNALPALYVEIDNNYLFTRVYLEAEATDETASAKVDIDLSYPTEVTIVEPTDYTDIKTVITTVLSSFYNGLTE